MAFLDQEAKHKIHYGSLELLSDLGVRVDHEEVLNRLDARGAKVDRTAKIARLPESLIEWALKTAPSSIVLADRSGRRYTLRPGGDTVYWTGNALYMVEGDRRVEAGQPFLRQGGDREAGPERGGGPGGGHGGCLNGPTVR